MSSNVSFVEPPQTKSLNEATLPSEKILIREQRVREEFVAIEEVSVIIIIIIIIFFVLQ